MGLSRLHAKRLNLGPPPAHAGLSARNLSRHSSKRKLSLLLLQVVTISKTAVGIGVQCDDPKCTWDSVPFMQNNYTSGHRQLMLDCLQLKESQPSQQHTQVVIVQRQLAHGRSMLNVLEVQDALVGTGAQVSVFSTAGRVYRRYVLLHVSGN